MKRKLFSTALSAFALFLLMGAADVSSPAAALVAEESAVPMSAANVAAAAASAASLTAEQMDPSGPLQLAGISLPTTFQVADAPTSFTAPEPAVPATTVVGQTAQTDAGSGYVDPSAQWQAQQGAYNNGAMSLSAYAQAMDPSASIAWDGQTLTITAKGTVVTATSGRVYLVANDRYLYVPGGVQVANGQVYVPEAVAAKAFSGLTSGGSFYDQEALFWLSRVIQRESGNQSMEGKMAVGNVILNRVADPAFPNSIEGVLAQKNQFTTYQSGALRNTKPSANSIIAAKLVLDGGVVEATRGATFFDSSSNSWASRNKQYIATIGGHNFYG